MSRAFLSVLLVAVVVMFASTASAQDACKVGQEQQPVLESNEFFTVESPSTIQFYPDVYFEVVSTKDGTQLVRYGRVVGDQILFAEALECGCSSGCTDSKCDAEPSGGSATCRGGCYEGDGTACVSCQFREKEAIE